MSRKTEARSWYTIRAEEGADEAEILIYDEIGFSFWNEGVTAKKFIEDLNEIEAETLNVRINSPGGDVFEGLAIYNALSRREGTVITHVDGLAASAASIVAMAGSEIRMAENAFLMIHNAWGFVVGNKNDMTDMAETLDKIDGSLVGTYARRTGQDRGAISDWMNEERWFDAEEAVEFGFADSVTEGREAEARAFNLEDRFRHPPADLVARMKALRQEDGATGDDRLSVTVKAEQVREIAAEVVRDMMEAGDESAKPEPEMAGAREVFVQSQRLLARTADT